MTKTVFIYHDYVHHNAPLWFALQPRYDLRLVNANDIINDVLNEKPAAFIMPGGASRYVAAKLLGRGNEAIKNYVAQGGHYIGICAGAYYACARVLWQHEQQHFDVSYDLNLCPAIARGPIVEYCDGNNTARLVTLVTPKGDKQTLYWGGPKFTELPDDAKILAHYSGLTQDSAAIIEGPYSQGRYLLLSPHAEYDHAALELMRFDVVDNKYSDLAALPDTSALTLDYFYKTLSEFLNQ